MKEKFKFLEHTADIKFQAYGKGIEECFVNSAYALKEIITSDRLNPLIKKKIKIKGKDLQNLLYKFLEEFLFLVDTLETTNQIYSHRYARWYPKDELPTLKKKWKIYDVQGRYN